MIQRFILALLVSLTLVAVGCSEEEKKSSTSDTGSTSGSDGTSGATSGTSGSDGTSGATSGTSGSDGTSGTTSGNDGTSGTTAEDTGSTSGDTSGSTSGTTDLCQPPADLEYLASTLTTGQYAGETRRGAASGAASSCGLANVGAEDPKAAVIDCMKADPHNIGLSDGCTGCYGDIVLCTIQQCIAQCVADPSATICTDCQEEKGCVSAFDACTGPLPE